MHFSKTLTALEATRDGLQNFAQTDSILVRPPHFKNILADMEECLVLSQYTKAPRCMMLTGESGVGKSTILETFEAAYPRVERDTYTEIPVFQAEVPDPVTLGGVISSLLHELGDPHSEVGTIPSRAKRLFTLLSECKVRLIILDEFQHLTQTATAKQMAEISDWLKSMINKTKIPVVLCGIPSALDVLRCNSQLMGRFPIRTQINPYYWDEDRLVFTKVLDGIDRQLPFAHPAGLAEGDMPLRLMAASNGCMRPLMGLIKEACIFASTDHASRISTTHLANAYRKVGLDVAFKPFEAEPRDLERRLQSQKLKGAPK